MIPLRRRGVRVLITLTLLLSERRVRNMSDESKKREEEEAKLYPEINQGLEILNEAGEWVVGREKEQIIVLARGFMISGIIGILTGNAVKVLIVICSFTNKFRNTTMTNKTIMKYAGMTKTPLDRVLKELKFYNIISSHYLPGGSLKKRRRRINIIRWDTARARLIKEKKIKLGLDDKIDFIIPNPFRK